MIELSTLNAILDVILKTVIIILLGYIGFVFVKFNKFVEKAERSVESIESTAEAVEKSIRWGRFLPFIGGKE